jgi:hypothetical protein
VESEFVTSAQSPHFTHLLELGETGLESNEILMRWLEDVPLVCVTLCDVAQAAGDPGFSFWIAVWVSGF